MIRKKFQPKIYENEFDAFINTKKGSELFKKFARKELSSENIYIMKKLKNSKKLKIKNIPKEEQMKLLEILL